VRYAILGDIHSNIEALEAVLKALRSLGVDQYVQVGDIVGYGADPGPCIQAMRDIHAIVVAGNHDWAVIGKLDTSYFNPYAREAVEWTRAILSQDDKHYLERLPLAACVNDEIEVVHATLDQPELFDYIQTYYDAGLSLDVMSTPACFSGHSHVPVAFLRSRANSVDHSFAPDVALTGVERALINVGSVGQPRDDNPLTAFAVYDSKTREYRLYRIPYDARKAAAKIRKVGLPTVLGDRLLLGR
jgi:diadenosine tetraphosphatase ApaH/serine/threonine PP2A family protein phosphatase